MHASMRRVDMNIIWVIKRSICITEVKMLNCFFKILKMTWCIAVGCSNNLFMKNRIKEKCLPVTNRWKFKEKMASKFTKFTKFTKMHQNLSSVFWTRLFQTWRRANSN